MTGKELVVRGVKKDSVHFVPNPFFVWRVTDKSVAVLQ